jgi:acetyl esterase/lipase
MSERSAHKSFFVFVLAICFVSAAFGQQASTAIPIDTTYTVASTFRKLIREYPHIKPVQSLESDNVKEVNDAVYSVLPQTPFGKRDLHADIFIPQNKKKALPAIMIVHGGGWRSGNKSLNTPMAKALARNGFVVVSVEYRLSLEAKYPAAVHDLRSALSWIRHRAKEFQIDTSKIAVAGYSAGGQLASLIGVTGNKTEGTKVHAVIDLDGLLDFTDPESLALPRKKDSADVFWFDGFYEDIPERWREASPLTWVHPHAPPFLFINSSQTRFHAGCARMVSLLNEHGIYSEVHKLTDAPHSYWLFDPWFGPTIEYMTKFLNKVFHLH